MGLWYMFRILKLFPFAISSWSVVHAAQAGMITWPLSFCFFCVGNTQLQYVTLCAVSLSTWFEVMLTCEYSSKPLSRPLWAHQPGEACTPRQQYYRFSRNIAQVTPKIIYFHYPKTYVKLQSIQNDNNSILKNTSPHGSILQLSAIGYTVCVPYRCSFVNFFNFRPFPENAYYLHSGDSFRMLYLETR